MRSCSLQIVAVALISILILPATGNAFNPDEAFFEVPHKEYEKFLKTKNEVHLEKLIDMAEVKDNTYAAYLVGHLFFTDMVSEDLLARIFTNPNKNDLAYYFFLKGTDNFGPRGYRDSAMVLALNFYGEKKSKYFDLALSLRILDHLVDLEVSGALSNYAAVALNNIDIVEDKQNIETKALEYLNQHANSGAVNASCVYHKYVSESSRSFTNNILNNAKRHLVICAEKQSIFQEYALSSLINMKLDEGIDKTNAGELMRYLKLLTEFENVHGHYLYGKYLMLGLLGDSDYETAEIHLRKALALGHKNAQRQIDALEDKIAFERDIANFSPSQEELMFFFSTAMGYQGGVGPNEDGKLSHADAFESKSLREESYSYRNNSIYSSSGDTWRITGDTVRNLSSGEYYRFSGDTIRGSNGSTWKYSGNTIRNLNGNGNYYRVTPRGIRGSDGTFCRRTNSRMNCY